MTDPDALLPCPHDTTIWNPWGNNNICVDCCTIVTRPQPPAPQDDLVGASSLELGEAIIEQGGHRAIVAVSNNREVAMFTNTAAWDAQPNEQTWKEARAFKSGWDKAQAPIIAERDAKLAVAETREGVLREALVDVGDWLADPQMTTWPYLEGTYFHRDRLAKTELILAALATASEPVNTCEMPEVAAMRYIEQLRANQGASVTMLCDNEEATYRSEQMAIEVCDDWTGWEPRRFYGESVVQCLALAIGARHDNRLADALIAAVAQSKGL